jgi:osmotically-inducible protein OsmY
MADRNDYDRGYDPDRDRSPSSNPRYGEEYGRERSRWRGDERGGREHDRGFIDRASDQVRSWFGDEEAARRRHRDDAREYREDYGRRDVGRERGLAEEPGRESWRGYGGGYGTERGYATGEDIGRSPSYGAGASGESPARDWRDTGRFASDRGSWSSGRFEGRNLPWERQSPGSYSYGTGTWTEPGPFTGRGPRGYQRSDERVREDICDRLTRHGRVDATDIQVTVRSGEVTLEGIVDSREAKRLAEDVAESVDGVRDVTNHLRTYRGGEDATNRTTGSSAAQSGSTTSITGATATGSIDKNR